MVFGGGAHRPLAVWCHHVICDQMLFLSVQHSGEVRCVHVTQQRLQRPPVAGLREQETGPGVRVAGRQRAGLSRMKALDGTGQPDQTLQTLNRATAIMHQLMLRHRPSAEGNHTVYFISEEKHMKLNLMEPHAK